MCASVNPPALARFEGGTAPVESWLQALRRMADAGYPVGLIIAPIIAAEGWEVAYLGLLDAAAEALDGVANPDLTVELITHRFNAASKVVLEAWYPGSLLDMSARARSTKRTRFGSEKQVYDVTTMRSLRGFFANAIPRRLPTARILYWT